MCTFLALYSTITLIRIMGLSGADQWRSDRRWVSVMAITDGQITALQRDNLLMNNAYAIQLSDPDDSFYQANYSKV